MATEAARATPGGKNDGKVHLEDGTALRFVAAPDECLELRAASGDEEGTMPTLVGWMARFDEWAEIRSWVEGHFLERFAPGAFKKTFAENVRNMRVLFQHGMDPQVGEKVLGSIGQLAEESGGARYEVPLFDTSYVRDLLPGLKAGEYGTSFRFRVMKEEREEKPERSKHNPEGLPERTVTEAKVMEFGPVTFPAYEGATAGLRSATDWWAEHSVAEVIRKLSGDADRAAALAGGQDVTVTVSGAAASEADTKDYLASELASRSTPGHDFLNTEKEKPSWLI